MARVQPYEIVVDRTPPEKGIAEVITTLDRLKRPSKQLCQIPHTFIEVKTFGWIDKESGVLRYIEQKFISICKIPNKYKCLNAKP